MSEKHDPAVPARPIGNIYCGTWTDRTRDLEALVRQANAMTGCRSFQGRGERLPGDAHARLMSRAAGTSNR
jgi:hypothetical protein